ARNVRGAVTVTWGNCAADRSAPPFWPWRDLVATRPVLNDADDAAIGAQRFELLREWRDQLVGDTRPRLHVIEDLQWADVASVLLLAHLAPVIADAPLMIIA